MKIKIEDIPKEGLTVNIDEDVKKINQILKDTDELGAYFINSIHAELFLSKNSTLVFIKGIAKGNVSISCGRCLKDFILHLYPEINMNLYPRDNEIIYDERELSYEDLEVGYYENEIDISGIIRETLFLDIPIKPLCNINCKGLCPSCGIDLNKESCLCFNENIDIKFNKLRDFILSKGC